MRSFIAIELTEPIRSSLKELQQDFIRCGTDVRWVKPGNIHLTLKFLGEIEDKNIRDIVKKIDIACRKYMVFRIEISGTGVFPNTRAPRVLWVGVDDEGALVGLQGEIEKGISSLGYKTENRKFVPHITLGRFRSSYGKAGLIKEVESRKSGRFGSMEVRSVCLMRSDLGLSGARYTKIAEAFLSSS